MIELIKQFGISADSITPYGNGLINKTWIINTADQKYILQKINRSVFKSPEDIAFNIRLISDHLRIHYPVRSFVTPIKTLSGKDIIYENGEWYRMFLFIEGSHTIDVVEDAEQAFEAAKQFGRFTAELSSLDTTLLKITLPHFHDLNLRFVQFESSLKSGNPERIKSSNKLIRYLIENRNIVDEFQSLVKDPALVKDPEIKLRVTHHDTKISNVLFDTNNKGLAVIDLDTVMPGYFFSDVGDMMRTYLCPVSEEEKDFEKIIIRPKIYSAIIEGYTSEMGEELTGKEKALFFFAGKFMIYMQALRFLTEHLNDDVYYGAKYPGHNFIRAGNQVTLLIRYFELDIRS